MRTPPNIDRILSEPRPPVKEVDAIDYAQSRASFRSDKIRILKPDDAVERTIAFNEADRRDGDVQSWHLY
jgi:hypothetical protein